MKIPSTVGADALSSIVVFLVALPLCMGIAIASGAPPAAGLITGIVGGLIVGAIQGSALQVSGPAAGLAVIVFDLIQRYGLNGLAVLIVAAGGLQMIAGAAKGGRWFRAVPPSVINGMLGGIGVLIFASQIHVMVDDKPRSSGLLNLISIPEAIWKGIRPQEDLPHEEAAIIGVLTIIVLVLWNKAPKKLKVVPAPLVGVIVGTLVANILGFPIAHVNVPDSLIAVMKTPSLEDFKLLLQPAAWGSVAVLAIVASAETLLSAAAVDKMHSGARTNFNRELFGQGVGNSLAGFFGGLPMTGVIVRSTANVQAGAKTRLSTVLHGAWLLLLVAALPQVLRLVPVSSLAAVLVFTGYKLVNPAVIKQLRKYGKSEVLIYAVTVCAIVATDLLKGVLIGLAIAVGKMLLRMSQLEITVEDDEKAKKTVLHLKGSATFLRLPDIAEALESVPADRELHVRLDDLDHLDHATLELLKTWEEQCKSKGGDLIIDWSAVEQTYHLGRRGAAEAAEAAAAKGPTPVPAPEITSKAS